MTKTMSNKEKRERELLGIFLIGMGVGVLIGALIMFMFWGA